MVTKKASEYRNFNQQSKSDDDDSTIQQNEKLINIIYNEGEYYLYEPANSEEIKYNIIDNHLWLVTRFMPSVCLSSLFHSDLLEISRSQRRRRDKIREDTFQDRQVGA